MKGNLGVPAPYAQERDLWSITPPSFAKPPESIWAILLSLDTPALPDSYTNYVFRMLAQLLDCTTRLSARGPPETLAKDL